MFRWNRHPWLSGVACGGVLAAITLFTASAPAAALPKMIAYGATPSPYFNEHAGDVAEIYDGIFFTIGSWDEGVAANLGFSDGLAPSTPFMEQVRDNLAHLRDAGVTENLLGVSFGESAPWPSAETLLSAEYTQKMAAHFGRLGQCARALGFCGVSIDVEYPYKRYSLEHPDYDYQGYTADDLLAGARTQGRAIMGALLDGFPDAVVFELPGYLWSRPIERAFTLGMLDVMADRDAPGGFHLGTERSYCLLDPVAQFAIAREGDLAAHVVLDARLLDYWKRRCTIAPGVWPLHRVETGGKDYPIRPWPEELAELRQQMEILRTVSKRYTWSYSGAPVWIPVSPELSIEYGLPLAGFQGAEEAILGWHAILRDKKRTEDPGLLRLAGYVEQFDSGALSPAEFCGALGTPGDWLLLGPLGNPFVYPAFAAQDLPRGPIDFDAPVHGRDGLVRWYPFHNYEPLGAVRLREAMDWRGINEQSTLLSTLVVAEQESDAYLWFNWDDGAVVYLNQEVVLDRAVYPPKGHGLLYQDRYLFEEHIPISLKQGENLLTIVSINAKGSWGVNARIGDVNGFPLEGISFKLPGNR